MDHMKEGSTSSAYSIAGHEIVLKA